MAPVVHEAEVTIVGGGPVGMGLAIELGQRGVEVVVIEKEAELHRIPKGQNLTQRTMEHFRVWGVEDEIRAARLMPPGFPAAGVNAWESLSSGHAHPWFRRSQVGQYYFAANERLPQYLTEEVLRRRAESLPSVSVHYGERVTDVAIRSDDPAGAVEVVTERGVARSTFVVGCDGSRSVVRRGVGITEEIRDHDRRMVLLVFRSPELYELLSERFGEAAFFNVLHPDLDGYWRFLGAVDVVEQWFFHAPVPSDSTVDDVDHEALLHDTVGQTFAIELDHIGFWDLRVAIAESYRMGPAFLAGDAAHSHPPYGGYGINTGFDDARNLGWKLAAHLQGWAGANLLDSYHAERRPVFVSTAEDFIESFIDRDRRFIAESGSLWSRRDSAAFAEAWERRRTQGSRFGISDYAPNYAGSPIVRGGSAGETAGSRRPSAVGIHDFVARPGHHLPPSERAPGLFDRLGSWFTLLVAPDRSDLVGSVEKSASRARVPLVVQEVADMSSYRSDAVLVRPDHHVAWVDDESEADLSTLLSDTTGG